MYTFFYVFHRLKFEYCLTGKILISSFKKQHVGSKEATTPENMFEGWTYGDSCLSAMNIPTEQEVKASEKISDTML